MNPINHPNCHRDLAKPPSWDNAKHGECVTLPIEVVEIDNLQFMVSYWRPTPDEIAAITSGAAVKLGIQGRTHPVVMLGVEGSTL